MLNIRDFIGIILANIIRVSEVRHEWERDKTKYRDIHFKI